MSCDLVLQLGFSFCQNGSSCSGLLMSWHIGDIRQVEHSTKARCIDHLHTRSHTYIYTQNYIYISSILVYLFRKWATIANGLASRLGWFGRKVSDRMPAPEAADANTVE